MDYCDKCKPKPFGVIHLDPNGNCASCGYPFMDMTKHTAPASLVEELNFYVCSFNPAQSTYAQLLKDEVLRILSRHEARKEVVLAVVKKGDNVRGIYLDDEQVEALSHGGKVIFVEDAK